MGGGGKAVGGKLWGREGVEEKLRGGEGLKGELWGGNLLNQEWMCPPSWVTGSWVSRLSFFCNEQISVDQSKPV